MPPKRKEPEPPGSIFLPAVGEREVRSLPARLQDDAEGPRRIAGILLQSAYHLASSFLSALVCALALPGSRVTSLTVKGAVRQRGLRPLADYLAAPACRLETLTIHHVPALDVVHPYWDESGALGPAELEEFTARLHQNRSLRRLSISGYLLTDASVSHLVQLPSPVTSLALVGNQLSGLGLQHLAHYTSSTSCALTSLKIGAPASQGLVLLMRGICENNVSLTAVDVDISTDFTIHPPHYLEVLELARDGLRRLQVVIKQNRKYGESSLRKASRSFLGCRERPGSALLVLPAELTDLVAEWAGLTAAEWAHTARCAWDLERAEQGRPPVPTAAQTRRYYARLEGS